MVKTRKSLWAAGFALLVCILLLIGTTFAWFTDSVSNRGNKIQVGNLEVSFAEFDPAAGGYVAVGEKPIFNYDKWEPGYTDVACVKIGNEGTLALKYKLDIIVDGDAGELADVIDVYYVADEEARTTLPTSTEGMEYIGTLSTVLNSAGENGIAHGNLVAGEADFATIALHMQENAGNEYQGASIGTTFDIVLNATQLTYETDGFGNPDYDENATYDVINQEELSTALEQGGSVSIGSDMTFAESTTISGDTQTTLNLRDNSEVMFTGAGIIDLNDNAKLTINGEGTLNQNWESELGLLIRANDDSRVVIESGTFVSGLTCVQAGDNAQVEIYGGYFEALVDWNNTYWLLNLIDNSNASITVYGGTFVNFDPSNSATENPKANFVADGYKVVSEQHGDDVWYTVVPE